MATDTPVAARIRTALGEYLKRDPSSIAPSHALRDDLGLDSMATIELLFRIEEAFDLQIPDEDLQALVTVGDVTAYVEKRLRPSKSDAKPDAGPGKPAGKRSGHKKKT